MKIVYDRQNVPLSELESGSVFYRGDEDNTPFMVTTRRDNPETRVCVNLETGDIFSVYDTALIIPVNNAELVLK